MTAFIDLQGEIKSDVPQADTILVVRAVRRSTRKFCHKTRVLETTTNPYLDLVADQATYTLPAVANRDIFGAQRGGVWWGDEHEIFPKSADELDLEADLPQHYRLPAGDSTEAGLNFSQVVTPWQLQKDSEAIYFYQPQDDVIRLVPIPNAAYTAKLKVVYALKPSRTATEVDDFVVNNWYEDLVLGAVADLLQIPSKPWTNVREGEKKQAQFETRLGEIMSNRISGFASQDYGVGKVKAWP